MHTIDVVFFCNTVRNLWLFCSSFTQFVTFLYMQAIRMQEREVSFSQSLNRFLRARAIKLGSPSGATYANTPAAVGSYFCGTCNDFTNGDALMAACKDLCQNHAVSLATPMWSLREGFSKNSHRHVRDRWSHPLRRTLKWVFRDLRHENGEHPKSVLNLAVSAIQRVQCTPTALVQICFRFFCVRSIVWTPPRTRRAFYMWHWICSLLLLLLLLVLLGVFWWVFL